MSKADDVLFKVKGHSVSVSESAMKRLPLIEKTEAYHRLRALGSAVAGFTKPEAPATTPKPEAPAPAPEPKKSPALSAAENAYAHLERLEGMTKELRKSGDFSEVESQLRAVLYYHGKIPDSLIIKSQKLVKKILGRSHGGGPTWERLLTPPGYGHRYYA